MSFDVYVSKTSLNTSQFFFDSSVLASVIRSISLVVMLWLSYLCQTSSNHCSTFAAAASNVLAFLLRLTWTAMLRMIEANTEQESQNVGSCCCKSRTVIRRN
jgi:hypothetical protein